MHLWYLFLKSALKKNPSEFSKTQLADILSMEEQYTFWGTKSNRYNIQQLNEAVNSQVIYFKGGAVAGVCRHFDH